MDEFRSCSTASSKNAYTHFCHLLNLLSIGVTAIAVVTLHIWKPSICLYHNRNCSVLKYCSYNRNQFVWTERAVYTKCIYTKSLKTYSCRDWINSDKGSTVILICHSRKYWKICIFLCGENTNLKLHEIGEGLKDDKISTCLFSCN